MERVEPDLDSSALQAVRFAKERLGPLSRALIDQPEALRQIEALVGAGRRLEDAVLQQVFRAAKEHRGVANEFFSYFLFGVVGVAKDSLAPQLRRMVDTGDLLDSVMGSLWEDLRELHFETRGQFVGLVAQALRWKAAEYDRRMKTLRRREDMQVQAGPEVLQAPGVDRTPSSMAVSDEERVRLPELLERLPARDRLIMQRYLKGVSLAEIARDLGLGEVAAQKALERAIQRARELGLE
ncbi:MAG: sigma-70 family RNA polymerase sigma factor [Planctomycetota bacterium]|nr:MAG: sigma-70 family RNA polymerase sigma factor [Planctomycetota bacterium]